ncbi:hypothetical protein STVA_33450 [Allostella vacuolata]|nr:hypothetical protein STVA_33450 [Stella vacuolata]
MSAIDLQHPPARRPLTGGGRTRILLLAFVTALLLSLPGIVMADDDPTPAERARIEAALRTLGFVSWDDIEREDGGRKWEIDDAVAADGTKWDLELAADDLRVLKRERD